MLQVSIITREGVLVCCTQALVLLPMELGHWLMAIDKIGFRLSVITPQVNRTLHFGL